MNDHCNSRISRKALRVLALLLVLMLACTAPAGAFGFWRWLAGGDEPTPVPVEETVLPAQTLSPVEETAPESETLPPMDDMWDFETAMPVSTPAPTPAPIPAATIEDDGFLRVELRSLYGQTQLHMTIEGVYAVDGDPGFRFDRGAWITLSAAEGRVYLSAGGLTIDMGQSMRLTRHRAEDSAENGVYIDESEKETLYRGDLTVSAEEESLRVILTIHVEDYLYGVVAYEMSDAFPIEALKAQAVAARTYAMQRKWQSGSRDYDLVDTTADQVFKGYSPEYTHVIEAVDATRGVVGLYNGTFAVCYYTASNGGQTALASQIWGMNGDDGYLAVTDDPYDLENPKSPRSELTVDRWCAGSDELKAMLVAALGERLAEEGYGEGEWEFYSIASIEPVDPLFEGTRMYGELEFGLRARLLKPIETPTPVPTGTPEPVAQTGEQEAGAESAQADADGMDAATTGGDDAAGEPQEGATFVINEASGTTGTPADVPTETDAADALAAVFAGEPMPTAPDEALPTPTEMPREWVLSDEIYTVTLDVYAQIKDGLSMGLNRADCELISVETVPGGDGETELFTLIMRRFGHGVGMSQRGAQRMAGHYEKGWQEIISFYYPGLSVERMQWPEQTLTDLADLPSGVGAARPRPTATPTPAPLPELEEGEYYAEVIATSLNVREQPTTAARAIAQLAMGRRIIVCGDEDADGWVPMRTAELHGYVKAEYLKRS